MLHLQLILDRFPSNLGVDMNGSVSLMMKQEKIGERRL